MSDFDRLRKVAEAATAGPWTAATSNDVFGPRGVDGGAAVVGYGMCQRNALHFATFDPQTVTALLDVAEAVARHASLPLVPHSTEWDDALEDVYASVDRLREATGHE